MESTDLDLDIDVALELIDLDEPIPLDVAARLMDRGIDVDELIKAQEG